MAVLRCDSERYVAMFPLNKLEVCVLLSLTIAAQRSAAAVEMPLNSLTDGLVY